ncbi:PQQ repeat-containing enzyme [Rhizodiscina lignyota]|uniref:PQQ repeat-containing enzyme n=1 Tax=Rhizodiscina lignyota TaxID=1504668 RepID=A0A9P4I8L2_9PEZI|nr:PQQ repeat-containing enzyme [Rhizodiscina lignyota]
MEQSTLGRRGLGLRGVDHNLVSPGYVLFAHLTSPGIVRLISTAGHEVHRWNLPYRPGRHARILPNGNLAYNGVHPDGPDLFPMFAKYRGGMMMEVDPQGKVVRCHEDPLAHHDQNQLGNGEIIYTTLEAVTPEQAASIPGGIPDSEAPDGNIYADCIKHVDGEGKLLWSWKAIEHLDPAKFPLHPHYAREHYPLINSVSILSDGNILASLRSVSGVIIISRETKDVIWHLDSTVVSQQHFASELSPSGDILIFDNGTFRYRESATYSRVIQVSRATKQITWQYKDPNPMTFFSAFMGGAQRLANGNTFITEAAFGRMFEVTPDGKMVWEYVNEDFADYSKLEGAEAAQSMFDYPSNAVFRAYKYTPEEIPWLKLPN